MSHRSGKLNVSHSFSTNLGLYDLHTAFFTDGPTVFHAFVFTAVTFEILHRTKNFCAEQTVSFRFERPIIYSFRFLDLTM